MAHRIATPPFTTGTHQSLAVSTNYQGG